MKVISAIINYPIYLKFRPFEELLSRIFPIRVIFLQFHAKRWQLDMSKMIPELFKSNPLGLIKRAFYKTIVGPLKFRKGNSYDAEKYWSERFSKYGLSFRGAGHEGLSEKKNREMYAEAKEVFIQICQREGIDFQNLKALEIGCGSGFYTELLHESGVKNYIGIDITDVLFPELERKFPEYKFIKKDVTSEIIEGKFDLVVMIDVVEHIVEEEEFSSCMENLKDCLLENGILILAPIAELNKKTLFYVRQWSLEDVKKRFAGYVFGEMVPFRGNYIITIRK
jgi:2-polyprenyl-3-methyl-5-hydroxy-6-metoxy-1,4-benzoquinol methylase